VEKEVMIFKTYFTIKKKPALQLIVELVAHISCQYK